VDIFRRIVCFFGLLVGIIRLGTGCTEEDYLSHSVTSTNSQPMTLSGKSFTFTVTGNNRFPEQFNSGYTINFQTPTTYVLYPTPMQKVPAHDQQGNYIYDVRNRVVYFAESFPVPGRTYEGAFTFLSPEAGSAHLTGRNGETQDVIFYESYHSYP